MNVVTGKPAEGAREVIDRLALPRKKSRRDEVGTFEEEPLGHQLDKVQTVQRQSVVEHDGPEVEGVEDGSDPARRCLRHVCLQKNMNIHFQ